MKCALHLAAMAVASTFAVATSACLRAQGLVDAPLPSYYAGHSASMPMAERAGPRASAVSQAMPLQWSTQGTQAGLVTNRGTTRAASGNVIRIGGIVAEGAEKGRAGGGKGTEWEGTEKQRMEREREREREKTDAERRATLGEDPKSASPAALPPSAAVKGEVYDGLPIPGRFESKSAPRVRMAPRAERKASVIATENDVEKEVEEVEKVASVKRDGEDEVVVDSQNALAIKDANRDEKEENCEDEDEDEDQNDELEEHFELVDRVLNSEVVQSMLGLIKENYELKAQLKIQAVEFKARQKIDVAKNEQRAAESRIQELERAIEASHREQHAAEMRAEAHAKEAMQHREMSQVALVKSAHETKELRLANQELQQQVEKLQAACEQTQRETLRKLDAAQRSKAELEHRARVLETQLEELRGKQESAGKEGKKKKER